MDKPKYYLEINKSKKTGEFYITPRHINGKIILKETYKSKKTLWRIFGNFVEAFYFGDYEIVDKTKKKFDINKKNN